LEDYLFMRLDCILDAAAKGRPLSVERGIELLRAPPHMMPAIMSAATSIRRRYFGDTVHLCSIVNARSGACPEDCAFCAQSVRHKSGCNVFGLLSAASLLKAHDEACKTPAGRFGIVTSGPTVSARDIERICSAVRAGKKGASWCASLGALSGGEFKKLKAAGVRRYHHNLETAEDYFPRICTTHSYAERLEVIREAAKNGLQVCSGGILGMGETPKHRVQLALALRAEKVHSIPLNFLMPIKGTPLGHLRPMPPMDILKCVAMFRFVNPRAEIKVCAGRAHLGSLQSMIFYAGATGIMIGDLLTIPGCDMKADLEMIKNLGLKAEIHSER